MRFNRNEVVRHHKTGVLGVWTSGANGRGIWFRPLDYQPKVHLRAATEPHEPGRTACGNELKVKQTDNADEVTCGSCLNQIRIRNFRVIMILAAFLLWWRATDGQGPE